MKRRFGCRILVEERMAKLMMEMSRIGGCKMENSTMERMTEVELMNSLGAWTGE